MRQNVPLETYGGGINGSAYTTKAPAGSKSHQTDEKRHKLQQVQHLTTSVADVST